MDTNGARAAAPDDGPRPAAGTEAALIALVAVLMTVAIVLLAPTARTGDPTAEIVTQVLLVLAGATAAYVLVRRFPAITTGFLVSLLTGLFLGGGAAILLNANAFGPIGAVLDQGFRTAQITRFAHEWALADFASRDLPAHYPPLYFWVLGRAAAVAGIAPWHMIKIGLLVVAVALPVATWALWRRVAGDRLATAVAVVASLVFQDWYAPYLWIAIVVFVPWWLHWGLGVGRDPQRRWTTGDLAVGIALGAFVLATYWFLLAIAAVQLLVLLAVRRPARAHGIEVLPRAWRGPAIVLGGTVVVTAVYWLPFLVSFMTTSGARMMQNRYFTAAEITLPTPFLTFDLQGLVLLAGLGYLLATATRRALSLHLLGVVGASYAVNILGYVGFLADTPLKTERVQGVIEYTLAAGAALGAAHVWTRVRGEVRLRDIAPTTIGVPLAVLAGVVLVGFGQTAVRSMPYLDQQRAARYPAELIADFERATGGRSANRVVLTDVVELNTFLPTYTFNTSNAHYSHPAALFNDRADLLTRLADEPDVDVFELALLHNRYDAIDLVALRENAGGLGYTWIGDAFPLGVSQETITFPAESFAGGAFVPLDGSELTMYRVDRQRDPLRALRSCPARPAQARCAVLRPLLARYSEHLDRATRDLATRWQDRR